MGMSSSSGGDGGRFTSTNMRSHHRDRYDFQSYHHGDHVYDQRQRSIEISNNININIDNSNSNSNSNSDSDNINANENISNSNNVHAHNNTANNVIGSLQTFLSSHGNNNDSNTLTKMLENEMWFDAYLRCLTYPQECLPVIKRRSKQNHLIYSNTPLGIACRKFNNKMVFVPPLFHEHFIRNDCKDDCDYSDGGDNDEVGDGYDYGGGAGGAGEEDDSSSFTHVNVNSSLQQIQMQMQMQTGQQEHQRFHQHRHQQQRQGQGQCQSQPQPYITQLDIIKALFQACPYQIRCNQIRVGQTPLLDILSNTNGTMEVTKFMIHADKDLALYGANTNILDNNQKVNGSDNDSLSGIMNMEVDEDMNVNVNTTSPSLNLNVMAIGRRDGNGLLPLHHLIGQVHRNTIIEPEQFKALSLIEYITQCYPDLLKHRCHHQGTESESESKKNASPNNNKNKNNVNINNNVIDRNKDIDKDEKEYISPLIHLLSQKAGSQKITDSRCTLTSHNLRMSRIMRCAKILLNASPLLIKTKSVMTYCTPLHMALRNGYGDNVELIKVLLQYDHIVHRDNIYGCDYCSSGCNSGCGSRRSSGYQLTQRNKFGDLPFHILATVGVSIETWRIMFDHVSEVLDGNIYSHNLKCRTSSHHRDPVDGPPPFIWTVNKHGYTILHLAWMRQINGSGMYPMSYTRNLHVLHREKIYYSTLKEGVNRVLSTMTMTMNDRLSNSLVSANDNAAADADYWIRLDTVARDILGPFWNIVKLFLRNVRAANDPNKSRTTGTDTDFQNFLHATCSLSGALLPRPIFSLIAKTFKHQAREVDSFGRLPLHYLCASFSTVKESLYYIVPSNSIGWYVTDDCYSSSNSNLNLTSSKVKVPAKKCVVEQLLALNREAASVHDNNGFFPLHLAMNSEEWLEFKVKGSDPNVDVDIDMYKRWSQRRAFGHCVFDWTLLVRLVAVASPDVLALPVPKMNLYPFMILATHSLGSLDIGFSLLRMMPTTCKIGTIQL